MSGEDMPKFERGSLTPLRVFVERYGLDGRPARNVRTVAATYGLTRLQVRATEARVLQALRQALSA